jgi:hypothetical protein
MYGGVADPNVIDLVTYDPKTDEVVLVMYEDRDWGLRGARLAQLEAKVDAYITYWRGDRLAREYPQMKGKLVRFQLLCRDAPGETEKTFINRLRKERLGPLELRLTVSILEEYVASHPNFRRPSDR